jgi:hypothetical protein
LVSRRDWRLLAETTRASDLEGEDGEGEGLPVGVREGSRFSPKSDWELEERRRLLLLFEEAEGEVWAERYKLPEEFLKRTVEGSERLAIALDVFSRANAAKVKRPVRFCLVELVDKADWRCLLLLLGGLLLPALLLLLVLLVLLVCRELGGLMLALAFDSWEGEREGSSTERECNCSGDGLRGFRTEARGPGLAPGKAIEGESEVGEAAEVVVEMEDKGDDWERAI